MYDEIKKKFETGEYSILGQSKTKEWWILYPENEILCKYTCITAIHNRKHKDILDAFLKGEEIEIYAGLNCGGWKREYNFISDYDEQFRYRLKLTNEDKQEISNQVDAIGERYIPGNEQTLSGNGKSIKVIMESYIKNDKNYEVIIKQI